MIQSFRDAEKEIRRLEALITQMSSSVSAGGVSPQQKQPTILGADTDATIDGNKVVHNLRHRFNSEVLFYDNTLWQFKGATPDESEYYFGAKRVDKRKMAFWGPYYENYFILMENRETDLYGSLTLRGDTAMLYGDEIAWIYGKQVIIEAFDTSEANPKPVRVKGYLQPETVDLYTLGTEDIPWFEGYIETIICATISPTLENLVINGAISMPDHNLGAYSIGSGTAVTYGFFTNLEAGALTSTTSLTVAQFDPGTAWAVLIAKDNGVVDVVTGISGLIYWSFTRINSVSTVNLQYLDWASAQQQQTVVTAIDKTDLTLGASYGVIIDGSGYST